VTRRPARSSPPGAEARDHVEREREAHQNPERLAQLVRDEEPGEEEGPERDEDRGCRALEGPVARRPRPPVREQEVARGQPDDEQQDRQPDDPELRERLQVHVVDDAPLAHVRARGVHPRRRLQELERARLVAAGADPEPGLLLEALPGRAPQVDPARTAVARGRVRLDDRLQASEDGRRRDQPDDDDGSRQRDGVERLVPDAAEEEAGREGERGQDDGAENDDPRTRERKRDRERDHGDDGVVEEAPRGPRLERRERERRRQRDHLDDREVVGVSLQPRHADVAAAARGVVGERDRPERERTDGERGEDAQPVGLAADEEGEREHVDDREPVGEQRVEDEPAVGRPVRAGQDQEPVGGDGGEERVHPEAGPPPHDELLDDDGQGERAGDTADADTGPEGEGLDEHGEDEEDRK
jgi:hypothetical protein